MTVYYLYQDINTSPNVSAVCKFKNKKSQSVCFYGWFNKNWKFLKTRIHRLTFRVSLFTGGSNRTSKLRASNCCFLSLISTNQSISAILNITTGSLLIQLKLVVNPSCPRRKWFFGKTWCWITLCRICIKLSIYLSHRWSGNSPLLIVFKWTLYELCICILRHDFYQSDSVF